MHEETKKKNILDLQFQKYLIVSSTSILLAFTYLIGIGIAIITKQIKLNDYFIMGVLIVISMAVLGICSVVFFNALFHLKNIPKVIKNI